MKKPKICCKKCWNSPHAIKSESGCGLACDCHRRLEEKKKCLLCGGVSPNTFGECICSYDPLMFSGDYKKIAKTLARTVNSLMRLATQRNRNNNRR